MTTVQKRKRCFIVNYLFEPTLDVHQTMLHPWSQAAEVQAIETFTLQLLISVDALRRDVVSDGAAYRAIFSWLLAVIQR